MKARTMGRRRKGGNADLPDFVYCNGHSYTYHHPITGQIHGIGADRALAIERGKLLNQRIWGQDRRRLAQLRRGQASLDAMLNAFAEHRKARVAPRTYREAKIRIEQYRRWFSVAPALITIDDINAQLEGGSYDVVRQHKILLQAFFEFCRAKGAIGARAPNHAELIIVPPKGTKRRQRLTLEAFWSIHARASEDLQTAMMLSLLTSMRRGDLVALTAANCAKPILRYIPQKTAENPDPMPTACRLTERHWARHVAPALLRAAGGRLIPRSPEWLTREFGDHAGIVTQLPPKVRPTLHEVRSLSDRLYLAQGDSKDVIRQRNAHRSERTTDVYLAGEIRYNEVGCELEIQEKVP